MPTDPMNAPETSFPPHPPEDSAPDPEVGGELITARQAKQEQLLKSGRHPSAMVPNIGGPFTRLLAILMRGVVFAPHNVSRLKEAESLGPVLLVVPNRSWLDYIYFNIAFAQHGIRLARIANGVRTWSVRPFWQAIRTLLRGRRGFPKDLECLDTVLSRGETGLVFLERKERRKDPGKHFGREFLRQAIQTQESIDRPIQVVPLLLVWDKHPDRHEPSLLDEVFGTPQAPGWFRKIKVVIQQTWESFLNLGAPQVQVSDPLNLQEFIKGRESEPVAALETRLRETIEGERRVIVGPGIKSARQIRHEILTDPRTIQQIATISEETNQDVATLQRRAGDALRSIAADFNLLVIKFFSALLTVIFNQLYDGLDVDEEGIQRLRRIARDKRVVLVPSHKSHIDYLLLSYVFYQRGLIPPHTAAGDNLSFWPVGSLFRRAGAFFLRRSFSDDPLYAAIFNAYVVKLLEERFYITFFIEGTRSRTGKLNPPRYGMLNTFVEAHRTGGIDDLVFVPVSVGYENIIEGADYQRELAGAEKKSESLTGLIRTSQVLRSRYGRVHVEVGEAIDTGDYLAEYHPGGHLDLDKDEVNRSVRRLAYRIIHSINSVTTVTPSSLATLILLNNPSGALDRESIIREAGFIISFLQEQKARLSTSLENAINARFATIQGITSRPISTEGMDEYDLDYLPETPAQELPSEASVVRRTDRAMGEAIAGVLEEALALLTEKGLVEHKDVGGQRFYQSVEKRRTELAFYKNNIIHYFIDEGVFAAALFPGNDRSVEVESVRHRAYLLSKLLKHEFCFAERTRFDTVFDRTLSYFSARGWLQRESDDVLLIPSPTPAGSEFFRGLMIPTLEAYSLTLEALIELTGDWLEERALQRQIHTRGEAMLLQGLLTHDEALGKGTINNALRVFQEMGIIEKRKNDRGRVRRKQTEYRLAIEPDDQDLKELSQLLSSLLEGQRQRRGELLRSL